MSKTAIEAPTDLLAPSLGFGLGVVRRPPVRLAHGGIVLDSPLILAPVDGVCDMPFRTICKEMGVGLTVSEIINANLVVHDARTLPDLISRGPNERPFSVQISDHEPSRLATAARMIADMGRADIIDLNMGCPSNRVTGSCNGASLLRDPPLVKAIVKAVVAAQPLPVTVKIRLGWDHDHINAPEIARIVEGEGAAMLTVHGRTRMQLFKGRADRARIGDVVRAVSIPVIGNGDIDSAASATDMYERSGCAGVMVGRGCFGDPWVLRRIVLGDDMWRPSIAERFAVARRHLRLSVEAYGEKRGVEKLRKHVAWYTTGMYDAAEFRDRYNRLLTLAECLDALETFEERQHRWSNRTRGEDENSNDIPSISALTPADALGVPPVGDSPDDSVSCAW